MLRSSFAMRARVGACALLAVGAVALGACGSSSSKSDSGGGPNVSGAPGSKSSSPSESSSKGSGSSTALCKLFTTDDVAKLFGKGAETAPAPNAGLATEQCVYKDKDRTANTPYWLFQTRHYTQPAVFDSQHVAYKDYTNLSGIGDAAFIAPDAIGGGYTIQVKKGNDVYTFDLSASNFGGTKPDIPKDDFEALVRSKLA
jgi:hypothetical protein